MTLSTLLIGHDSLTLECARLLRADGHGIAAVVTRHALKNALIPVVTYLGILLAGLLTGAVVTTVRITRYPVTPVASVLAVQLRSAVLALRTAVRLPGAVGAVVSPGVAATVADAVLEGGESSLLHAIRNDARTRAGQRMARTLPGPHARRRR